MKTVYLILLITFPFQTFAQYAFGISINPGVSMPTKSFTAGRTTYDAGLAPCFSGGLYFNQFVGTSFQFGTRIMFNQIKSNDKLSNVFIEDGRQIGRSDSRYNLHFSYISFPIYLGWHRNNYAINVGFRMSALLSSGLSENGHFYLNGNYSKLENEVSNLQVLKYDYGPELSFTYDLNDKFKFDATVYHGLINISTVVPSPWTWRVKHVSIGIRYIILTNVLSNN